MHKLNKNKHSKRKKNRFLMHSEQLKPMNSFKCNTVKPQLSSNYYIVFNYPRQLYEKRTLVSIKTLLFPNISNLIQYKIKALLLLLDNQY